MDRFVNHQNVERYRKLLNSTADVGRRRVILKLLTEAEEKEEKIREQKRSEMKKAS